MLTVEKIQNVIIPLAIQYKIEKVFLFGSYARGEATEKSDIDLRIDPGEMGGMAFSSFYLDTEEQLNCHVDIVTTRQLPKSFLAHIQKEEILLYDRQEHAAA